MPMGISKTEILSIFKASDLNVSSDAKEALETVLMKSLKAKVSALASSKKRLGKKTVYAEDITVMFA
jgi:histone H3/H4